MGCSFARRARCSWKGYLLEGNVVRRVEDVLVSCSRFLSSSLPRSPRSGFSFGLLCFQPNSSMNTGSERAAPSTASTGNSPSLLFDLRNLLATSLYSPRSPSPLSSSVACLLAAGSRWRRATLTPGESTDCVAQLAQEVRRPLARSVVALGASLSCVLYCYTALLARGWTTWLCVGPRGVTWTRSLRLPRLLARPTLLTRRQRTPSPLALPPTPTQHSTQSPPPALAAAPGPHPSTPTPTSRKPSPVSHAPLVRLMPIKEDGSMGRRESISRPLCERSGRSTRRRWRVR